MMTENFIEDVKSIVNHPNENVKIIALVYSVPQGICISIADIKFNKEIANEIHKTISEYMKKNDS